MGNVTQIEAIHIKFWPENMKGKKSLRLSRRGWGGNIKMYLAETGY